MPGKGAKAGGPSVTMISAGVSETKMAGICPAVMLRPGRAASAAAKFSPSGSRAKPAGSAPAGAQGPWAAGAESQAPSFSRNQLPFPAVSTKTSQFVLTATESPVSGTGTRTGVPSKTTRQAGRSLWKMRGGSLTMPAFSAGGAPSCCASSNMSRGTGPGVAEASAARRRCSIRAASFVSSEGKREETRRRLARLTMRACRSARVFAVIWKVPSSGPGCPGRSMPTATRAFSTVWPGQEMTCGW